MKSCEPLLALKPRGRVRVRRVLKPNELMRVIIKMNPSYHIRKTTKGDHYETYIHSHNGKVCE